MIFLRHQPDCVVLLALLQFLLHFGHPLELPPVINVDLMLNSRVEWFAAEERGGSLATLLMGQVYKIQAKKFCKKGEKI